MEKDKVQMAKKVLEQALRDTGLGYTKGREGLTTALQIIDEWEKIGKLASEPAFALEVLPEIIEKKQKKIKELEAELARYKTALEKIADYTSYEGHYESRTHVLSIAKQALAGEKEII